MPRSLFAALWGLCMILSATGQGQDFRVETEVFVGDAKEPIAETLTIFSGGRVYDFLLTGSQEITIFEPARGQFTLLDPERKLRCTVANQELLEYVLELNKAAIAKKGSLFAAAADPQFEVKEEAVEENQTPRTRVTLASKLITYTAAGKKPERTETVESFKQFADWYARLNATRGGNLPPAARLALNKELASRQLIPDEIVRVTNEPGLTGRKLEVRSRHLFNWALSVADQKHIEQAGDYLTNFQAVDYREFRTLTSRPLVEKTTKR